MRPCKNPPELTYANLLGAMLLDMEYSPARISCMFAQPVQAIIPLVDHAADRGDVVLAVGRGHRRTYRRPSAPAPGIADRRVGPAQHGGVLTGYEAELWLQRDLSMAARKLWQRQL